MEVDVQRSAICGEFVINWAALAVFGITAVAWAPGLSGDPGPNAHLPEAPGIGASQRQMESSLAIATLSLVICMIRIVLRHEKIAAAREINVVYDVLLATLWKHSFDAHWSEANGSPQGLWYLRRSCPWQKGFLHYDHAYYEWVWLMNTVVMISLLFYLVRFIFSTLHLVYSWGCGTGCWGNREPKH